jgi:hypothetical protein
MRKWTSIALVLGLAAGACASNPTPRCGPQGECGTALYCYRGLCLPNDPDEGSWPGDGGACPPLQIVCDHGCVDPRIDDEHCGTCSDQCDDDESCVDGDCLKGSDA